MISKPSIIHEKNEGQIKKKRSIVFDYIPEESLRTVHERNLTPEKNSDIESIARGEKENPCKDEASSDIEQEMIKHPQPYQNDGLNKEKYLLSSKSNHDAIIKFPNDIYTDDIDLKNLCDLINEKQEGNWKEIYNEGSIVIQKKSHSGPIMLKTTAVMEKYTKEDIMEAIADGNIRKQWDTIFSDISIVEKGDGYEIIYMKIKSPTSFVKDRDFVQKRKMWKGFPTSDSTIIHFKSVEHKAIPEKKHVIRGEILISGYFIKTLKVDPPLTYLVIMNRTDIKGSIPKWIVNMAAQRAPKDWVGNLKKGCEMVQNKRKREGLLNK